jgi:hypothetical protein
MLNKRQIKTLSGKPDAVRKRRSRLHKTKGELVLPDLVLSGHLRDGLVDLHWIGAWDRDHREAIAKALIEGLRQAVLGEDDGDEDDDDEDDDDD